MNMLLQGLLFFAHLALSYSVVLPVHVSMETQKCCNVASNEIVQCQHSGSSVYTTLTFGPPNAGWYNPSVHCHINLLLGSGSSITWLATKNTNFFDLNGQSKVWDNIFHPSVLKLEYSPEGKDRVGKTVTQTIYKEKFTAKLVPYKNFQLKLVNPPMGTDISIPMDLYFAEEYHAKHSCAMFIGVLGLKMSKVPEDVDNLFLYRFLKDRSGVHPLMSLDFNFNNGLQSDSFLGLGESLPIKNKLTTQTVLLYSSSDDWKINIDFITVEFSQGRRPQIQFKSTTGLLDTSATYFGMMKLKVQQMTIEQQKIFKKPYSFSCDQYEKLLPKITFGLRHEGRITNITIPAGKLYVQYKSEPNKCYSLLTQFEEQGVPQSDFRLGLPFFASTYVELSWYDTRNTKSWSDMNFRGKIHVTAKY